LKIEYQHTFGLPRNIVWKYVKDEKVLRNAIPSCRSFVESPTGFYQAQIDINIGPLKDVFALEAKLDKEQVSSYYHLMLQGKGNLGGISGDAHLFFNDQQGATQLTIQAEVKVTGTLSGPAERVLNGGGNKGIQRFFLSLEKEIKKKLYILRKGRK
jgi:uncharacterized protein